MPPVPGDNLVVVVPALDGDPPETHFVDEKDTAAAGLLQGLLPHDTSNTIHTEPIWVWCGREHGFDDTEIL